MKVLVTGASAPALNATCAAAVAAGHQVEVAATVDDLRAAFAGDIPPDGVILVGAASVQGVTDLRKQLGKRPAWIAAWVDDESAAWTALDAGADDVLVGRVDGSALALRLAMAERTLHHARTEQRLRYLARHPMLRDPTTGALRPGVLQLQLDQALARVERTQQSVALLALEASPIGLPADTDLTPLVLARVVPALRRGDAVAVGDDRDVTILLQGCRPEDAQAIAHDVVTRLTRAPTSGAGVTFSCAAGLATSAPGEPCRSGSELMDAAGRSLAQAWMRGGNRVVVAGMDRHHERARAAG